MEVLHLPNHMSVLEAHRENLIEDTRNCEPQMKQSPRGESFT